jgi:hypothetical protein
MSHMKEEKNNERKADGESREFRTEDCDQFVVVHHSESTSGEKYKKKKRVCSVICAKPQRNK